MLKRNKSFWLLCLLVLAVGIQGCRRIPMYNPDGGLYIDFDIDYNVHVDLAGDVDLEAHPELVQKTLGKMPEVMHVLFYDIASHELVYEDILPSGGGFVEIDPGFYDVIAYGMGTTVTRVSENLRNRGMGRAYTPAKQDGNLSTKAETPSGSIIEEPDQIYVGRTTRMEVPVHVAEERIIHLHIKVEPMVESWTFIAYNISGLQYVKSLTVRMTAQAPDRYLWDGRRTVRPVNLDFSALVNPETYSIKTVFNTFGKLTEFTGNAILQVEVSTASGLYSWQYDVSEQWDNPDNTRHLIIVTDHIDIPADSEDSGFGPGVNPWEPEIIPITL